MAGALPTGWIECGVTGTETLTMDVKIRAQDVNTAEVMIGQTGAVLYVQAQALSTPQGCVGLWSNGSLAVDSYSTMETVLRDSLGITTILNSGAGGCSPPPYLPAVAVTLTFSNLRLGVTIQDGVLRYAWFTDASSAMVTTVGGITVETRTFSDPAEITKFNVYSGAGSSPTSRTILGMGAQLVFDLQMDSLGGVTGQSTNNHVEYSAFTAQGAPTIPATAITEIASPGTGNPFFNIGRRFGWPFQWTVDIDADESDGTAEVVDATYNGARTTPSNFTQRTDWWDDGGLNLGSSIYGTDTGAATLADPWLSSQTIRPYGADQIFRFEGNRPEEPSKATQTTWTVGTLTLTSPLSVLRSTNAWTVDTGTVGVGGTSTVPIFTTTVSPGVVRRELKEHWRNWNTLADPLYQPGDSYTATKRDAYSTGASTPDAWGWSLYSYLDLDMTVPAGPDTELSVEVTWAFLRGNGTTIDTIVKNYSPVTFPAGGRSTQRVDLLFPTEIGRPFYGERVDTIRLVGLQNGVTTVHDMGLVIDQQAYAKIGGPQVTTADSSFIHGGMTLSVDGQMCYSQWNGDTQMVPIADADGDGFTDRRKDQQNGLFEVAATVYGTASQEVLGGGFGMTQTTLSSFFTEVNKLEGMTATYNGATMEADLTDAFATPIGIDTSGFFPAAVTRTPLWLKWTLPHARITKNVAYNVIAQLVVTGFVAPPGLAAANCRVFQRAHLGMTLDGQGVDSSFQRAAAAGTVNARSYTGGSAAASDPTIGTGTTDASGYVVVPIRNGQYKISAGVYSEFTAYLDSP